MKTRIFNRTLGILLSIAFLCSSLPAQDALGPQKLLAPPAPPLRGTTSLRRVLRPGRPMLGYVGRVGGVAFEAVAAPANGVNINSLDLRYSPAKRDGERLSLTVNGNAVSPAVYDWQLIPIAKFANSSESACFTLFGQLDDPLTERLARAFSGNVLNYHPSFKDTLVGLRLFQLDNLIINEYAYELPTAKGAYILGAGESAPGNENKTAQTAFLSFMERNERLFDYVSYLINDLHREITFDVKDGNLNIQGEPSYYFWDVDRAAYASLMSGESLAANKRRVSAELRNVRRTNSIRGQKPWLVSELQKGIAKYKEEVGDFEIVKSLGYTQLAALLSAADASVLLERQTLPSLTNRLAELRTLEQMPAPRELTELGQLVAGNIQRVRAINPAVWDTGVTVMRYAAFFRYVKNNHPAQWQAFMAQIERAPAPVPAVTTPTVMMPPGSIK